MNSDSVTSGDTVRVGAQLRRMRFDRGLSLEVVAGLAGFSAGFLSRVERGQAVLDRLSHWRGLADALGVSLPCLLRLPVPALNEHPGGNRPIAAGSRVRETG
ncbi:MAG: helix-turn-helix domain-containing protein [Pseudonocardiaceae bacterium]